MKSQRLISIGLVSIFLLSLTSIMHAAWYDTNFTYKRRIQIQSGQISSGPHANFPILVTEANVDTAFFAAVQKSTPSDMDIIFVDSTETTELDREIIVFDSSTEQFEAWVRIPSLSSATTIYMYYGYASATKPNSTSTWSSDYAAVWHMQQTPTGSTDDITESTINAEHGTSQNMETGDLVTGPIHGALSFDNVDNEYINCGTSTNLRITGLLTISGWIKIANATDASYGMILSKKYFWDSASGYEMEVNPNGNLTNLIGGGADLAASNTSAHDTNWHYLVGTVNNTTAAIYKDGSPLVMNDAAIGAISASNTNLNIGRRSGDENYFYGQLDEIRVQSVQRSSGWIATEFNNQSNPATFFSFGMQEGQGTPTHTPTISPTPTVTMTITPTITLTPTETVTATPSLTPSPSPTHSATSTISPTSTVTMTVTPTPSSTVSPTVTASSTIDVAAKDLTNVIAYPNPYRSDETSTESITFFNLPEHVTIRLYSLEGMLVRTLKKESAGNRMLWDLKNEKGSLLASGVYLYIIKSDSEVKKGKIVLLK